MGLGYFQCVHTADLIVLLKEAGTYFENSLLLKQDIS